MAKKSIIDVLEKVDKEFMGKQYASIRNKHFGKKSGIYALYDKKGKLYYVGRTSNSKGRLKMHLKNKHSGKWDRFSIYFTKNNDTAVAVEAIALALLQDSWPKGNTNKPGVKEDKNMKKRISRDMNEILYGGSSRSKKSTSRSGKNKSFRKAGSRGNTQKRLSLKELFNKGFLQEPQTLKKEYKSGKTFHAVLLPSGQIEYQGKKYSAPSTSAETASGSQSENGWTFWKIQNRSKKWITLDEFAKNPQRLNKLHPNQAFVDKAG